MKTLIAWLKIIRPPIAFIACLGVIVGALNSASFLKIDVSSFQIIMLILGAFFLASGLMIHNDVTDLKSDKVNRPNKPLSTGIIRVKTAFITSIALMFLSIIIALFINIRNNGDLNWTCGALTFLIVLVGVCYNYYGKYYGIWGHIAVAFGVGAIPYWGSIAIFPERTFLMFPFALAIFTQEIGREIMVNAGDYKGDFKAGFKTLPVQIGIKRSMLVALVFYLAFIPLYILPIYDWLGIGVPHVFNQMYLIGGTLFAVTLLLTWILTYRVLLQGDEKKIWIAFERYERTGTRVGVIVFQIFLLLDVFF
jgi:geranylgeranylglycerol-phosphate geranylgeranyltransferase